MSIWKESISEGTRSFFWGAPTYVGLPRAIVTAALRETARHPGIHTLPQLQKTLHEEQKCRETFRTAEMDWWIQYNGIIGGLLSDPDGKRLWEKWNERNQTYNWQWKNLQKEGCSYYKRARSRCNKTEYDEQIRSFEHQISTVNIAQRIWRKILYEHSVVDVRDFVEYTVDSVISVEANTSLATFLVYLQYLYNVTDPYDARVQELLHRIPRIPVSPNYWEQITVENLLRGTLWNVCLQHILRREGRIQDRMIAAGYTELSMNHERIYNASLQLLDRTVDKRVQEWFVEIAGYSWWLADDIPSLVRRCISQEHGECIRIGPTEISAMSKRFTEQQQIVGDWVRRIFIGMWNGMPVVGLLFLMELIVMCVPQKVNYISHSPQQFLTDHPTPSITFLPPNRSPLLTDGDT
jgi:hypothetical protein